MSISDLAKLLGDSSLTWTERRTRLQGWRGSDATCADNAEGAQRLGPAACAIGVAFLGGAAVAYAVGAATLGLVLALVLGGTAAFVAVTGICLPSMIFTLLWGVERACAPSLIVAARAGERVPARGAERR